VCLNDIAMVLPSAGNNICMYECNYVCQVCASLCVCVFMQICMYVVCMVLLDRTFVCLNDTVMVRSSAGNNISMYVYAPVCLCVFTCMCISVSVCMCVFCLHAPVGRHLCA
jgi:hypothetical protein